MLSKTRRKGKVESVGEDNKIEEWRVYKKKFEKSSE